MKSNSLLFLTSNRFGGVRKEGKFWVLNKFYNCYRTHRSGLVWLKWQFWVDGTFFCHHWETMVTISWVCCRFFICLYDLNTVCFLSSWSWDVVETQILVRLCLPEYCRENLVNLWILCFYQSNYRNTFEKVHKRIFTLKWIMSKFKRRLHL